jgi:predicted Zn-dependent peptidase
MELLKDFAENFKIELSEFSNMQIEYLKPNGFELYYYQKDNRNKVSVDIGAHSIPLKHKNINYMLFFNKYFGSDFTSILAQEIREKNGWSYYANSSFMLYKKSTIFGMEYAPDKKNLLKSITYLKDLYIKSVDNIDSNHLEFTKNKIINSYNFKFSTTLKKMSLISDLKLYGYPDNFFESYLNDISKVNSFILKEKLSEILNPSNQIVVMVGDVESQIKNIKNSDIFSKIVKLNNLNFLE